MTVYKSLVAVMPAKTCARVVMHGVCACALLMYSHGDLGVGAAEGGDATAGIPIPHPS